MTKNHKKWCIVRVYKTKKSMQIAYKKFRPNDLGHFKTLGAHCAYDLIKIGRDGRTVTSGETGTIFLHKNKCGAGIACHEILHGVLWAFRHRRNKIQYPFVLKSMEDEEELLHNFTYAITQFYQWYWEIENSF